MLIIRLLSITFCLNMMKKPGKRLYIFGIICRNYRASSVWCNITFETSDVRSMYRCCCRWIIWWIFPDEMFWYCDTCDRNNRSVCRKRETAESVICSTYDSPYNSGCIHCDNDHGTVEIMEKRIMG